MIIYNELQGITDAVAKREALLSFVMEVKVDDTTKREYKVFNTENLNKLTKEELSMITVKHDVARESAANITPQNGSWLVKIESCEAGRKFYESKDESIKPSGIKNVMKIIGSTREKFFAADYSRGLDKVTPKKISTSTISFNNYDMTKYDSIVVCLFNDYMLQSIRPATETEIATGSVI